MNEDYGILTDLVKTAGTLISAGIAIGLTWRGRAKWEPSEVDIPRGPERVAGLLTAVAIAIIWTVLADTGHLSLLTHLAIILAVIALLSLLLYSFLVATQTYKVITDTGEQKIIGGFSLIKRTEKILNKRSNEQTIQEFLVSNNCDPDKVWTRNSRALAKASFLVCYICLTVSGTIALSCAAIVFLLSTPNKEIQIRKEKKVIHIAIVLNGEIYYTQDIVKGFTSRLDELLEPTPYLAHYETTIGIAEASQANQNEARFNDLLSRFSGEPHYLITIGTQVSEYARQRYWNKIPIIFIGVTDPIGSGLVNSLEREPNRGMIAGTLFDANHPKDPYVDFFSVAFPGKKIGYVYYPKEHHQDDLYKALLLAEVAKNKAPFEVIPIPVNKPQISKEQQALADVFFGRYYVNKYLQDFISSSEKPFVTTSMQGVTNGAIASISTDTIGVGQLAAEQLLFPNLTRGMALSEMRIIIPNKVITGINLGAVRRYDISISQEAIDRADKLIP